jgi:hypothetical protein
MQTFLPYPDYAVSARCLDNKRLGKQRLECKQILLALGVAVGPHTPGKRGWRNHPAVRMWKGHESSLIVYATCVCFEWRRRGFLDNLGSEFIDLYCAVGETPAVKPHWVSHEPFHASHRSNLLRKDSKFYGKFGWAEPDDLPYIWPVGKDADESKVAAPSG